MTTPRVTVPVEPTEAMMLAADAVDWNNEDERGAVINMWQAMLTAAPVREEGGAVLANDLRCLKETFERIAARPPEDQPHYKSGVRPFGTGDLRHIIEVLTKAAALATREEAPAEAGDLAGALEFLDGAAVMLGRGEMPAPGSEYAARWWQAHAVALSALRAQPPAREDAQPDAGARLARAMWGVDLVPAAHPAPDALREDSQAWGMLADLVSWFTKPVQGQNGMVWVIPAGEQGADDAVNAALAALQAEQKGGA